MLPPQLGHTGTIQKNPNAAEQNFEKNVLVQVCIYVYLNSGKLHSHLEGIQFRCAVLLATLILG